MLKNAPVGAFFMGMRKGVTEVAAGELKQVLFVLGPLLHHMATGKLADSLDDSIKASKP